MRKTTRNNKYIHFTRYKSNDRNYYGYQVRIWKLPQFNKYFGFHSYGGDKLTLTAARDYRDKILKQEKMRSLLDRRDNLQPRTSNSRNSSGVIGVCLNYTMRDGVAGYYHWSARYSIDGKQRVKAFSVDKYGEKKAFLMACEMRLSRSKELIIIDKSRLLVPVATIKNYLKNCPDSDYIIVN